MKNKMKNSKKLFAIVLTAIMVLSLCAVGIVPVGAQPTVERNIEQDTVSPGGVVDVTIEFTTTDENIFLDLADHVPIGWNVTDISANIEPKESGFNDTNREVFFFWSGLPIPTGTYIKAEYKLHVPGDEDPGEYTLVGDLYRYAKPRNVPITGENTVEVKGVTPGLDLIVTEITPNCGYLFANESNEICAKIENIGTSSAGASHARFVLSDGYNEVVGVPVLASGENTTVCITDTTERNAGASATITVTADCDGEVDESNEANNESSIEKTVANNGYKSKAFAGLPSLVLHEHDTINGSIVYTVGNSSKVELAPTNTTTTGFDITIPGGATVKTARLYVYWYDSWYSAVHGDADLDVTFDGLSFTTADASYTDTKGFGTYDYPKGTYAYDVTSAVSGTGAYTATIENTAADTNTVLTGQLLLVVYEDATKSEMEYWITEGCDLLKADSNYCVSPEEAIANVTFAGTIDVTDKSASLITVVVQGNEAGTDLSFNAQVWEDVWQTPEGSSKIDIDDRDVTDYLLGNDNVVDFRDTGTQGMQASNAILVVEYAAEVQPDLVITDKWINWPINCTICYNITNTGSGTAQAGHNTTLYVDETEVAHGQVPQELTHGESYIGCFEGYGWVYTPLEDNITVCADYNETIDESNETNNCLTNIWKCGEVTGDGWILTDDGDLVYYVAGGLIDTGALTTEWAADVTGDGWILTDDGDLVYYVAGGLISESNLNCRCMG
jgi:hypothetical protein